MAEARKPNPQPVEADPNEAKRKELFNDAQKWVAGELAVQEALGESPLQAAQRRVQSAKDAQAAEIKAKEDAEGQAAWDLRNLKLQVADHDKFVFQINDLQNEVEALMVDNEHLRMGVEDAKQTGIATGAANALVGDGMVQVDGGRVAWRYDKESLGWFKATGNKVWIYRGAIRDIDSYYDVDSAAITLTDTTSYVYAAQNKTSGTTGVTAMATEPDDTTSEWRWPIAKFVRKDPDGGGDYTWEATQVYNTGDLQRKRLNPDGNSPYADRLKSLEVRGTSDTHNWDLQVTNWHATTNDTLGNADKFTFWPNNPTITDKPTKYATVATVATRLGKNLDGGLGSDMGDWLNDSGNTNIEHHGLNSTANIRANPNGDFRDNGGATNNDHDKRYWAGFAEKGTHDAKIFKTSGLVEAGTGDTYVATLAGGGKAANFTDGTRTGVIADGTTAGTFTHTTFSARLGDNTGGSPAAGAFVDGTREVYLADGTWAVYADAGIINSDEGYAYAGTSGVTGDGFSGGIKTNAANADAHIIDLIEMYV